jgi:1-acyl-sn-glycerol-3-phosphate acyltransferase
MANILSYPRAAVLAVLIPLVTMLFSAVAIFIIAPFANRAQSDKFIRVWAKTLCALSGIEIKVKGLENIAGIRSAILVSNHQALLDIPVLFVAIPLSFRMAAKSELFEIPVFGKAISRLGFFPVARGTPEKTARAFGIIAKRFERGESFWMAPEGTRYPGEGIGQFKSGAFYLAQQANQPIVPICIYGNHKVLPKNSLLINWGKFTQEVHVSILKPVYPGSEFSSRNELRDFVRRRLLEEFDRVRGSNGAPNRSIEASIDVTRC